VVIWLVNALLGGFWPDRKREGVWVAFFRS
jgi:hypothetical protein